MTMTVRMTSWKPFQQAFRGRPISDRTRLAEVQSGQGAFLRLQVVPHLVFDLGQGRRVQRQ